MPILKVTTLDDPNLRIYTSLTQAQLRNKLEHLHCREPESHRHSS